MKKNIGFIGAVIAILVLLLAASTNTAMAGGGGDGQHHSGDPAGTLRLTTCFTFEGRQYQTTYVFDRQDYRNIMAMDRSQSWNDIRRYILNGPFRIVRNGNVGTLPAGEWWFWAPAEYVGGCGETRYEPLTTDLALGQEYDLYKGDCGVYIPASTTVASATLGRVDSGPSGLKTAQDACHLNVVNADGVSLSSFGGVMNYYIVLDKFQYKDWLDGDLGLYIHDGSSWTACNAMLVGANPEEGEYGRLSCVSSTVGSFALGYE